MPESVPQRDVIDRTVVAFAMDGLLMPVALGTRHDTAVLPIRLGEKAATVFCNCEARVQA